VRTGARCSSSILTTLRANIVNPWTRQVYMCFVINILTIMQSIQIITHMVDATFRARDGRIM